MRLANDSAFGLGSYCFSGSQRRAAAIGARIKSGMFVVNDYASNAMCQSLPFGGVKESGFDRCASSLLLCVRPAEGLLAKRAASAGALPPCCRACRCVHCVSISVLGFSTSVCEATGSAAGRCSGDAAVCFSADAAGCRFGGIEGLRGMCVPRVVVLDRAPWLMKTALPPPLQYPVASFGFDFVRALCLMFYGSNVGMQLRGLLTLARLSLAPPAAKAKAA